MSVPDDLSIWLWAKEGVQSEFALAYAQFRQDLLKAFPDPQAVLDIAAAHDAYLAELHRSMQSSEPSPQVDDLGASYAKAVQQAFQDADARSRVMAAFDRYLDSVKQAWGAVDAASVQPADLAVIAQSIAWVAAVSGDVRQIGNPAE
jgi:hypothetical protein